MTAARREIERRNRERDERLLSMLDRRCKGHAVQEIADDFGVGKSGITNQTNRVVSADRDHDPADFQNGRGYW